MRRKIAEFLISGLVIYNGCAKLMVALTNMVIISGYSLRSFSGSKIKMDSPTPPAPAGHAMRKPELLSWWRSGARRGACDLRKANRAAGRGVCLPGWFRCVASLVRYKTISLVKEHTAHSAWRAPIMSTIIIMHT
jgi:hypothetical protein